MRLSNFNYNLPKELIAENHIEPRDRSRLLVLDRDSGQIAHRHFYDIADYLERGDVLVFNNSKVFKARILGTKKTRGRIELLLVRAIDNFNWESLVRGKVAVGEKIFFEKGLEAEMVKKKERSCVVKFNKKNNEVFKYLEKYGNIPLPPYIKTKNAKQETQRGFYQTVYANKIGSVAAPTAGFHFTEGLLDKLKKKGVEFLEVTLHVGPGTFLPVKTGEIEEHKMHEEFFEVDCDVWKKILQAKKDGRRVVAVGTTTCRVLESMAQNENSTFVDTKIGSLCVCGFTNIFIYPPYNFRMVDTLITNFHLPKSTLLMLVSAFADSGGRGGIAKIKKAYKEAVVKKYRFYSFGDSMLIK